MSIHIETEEEAMTKVKERNFKLFENAWLAIVALHCHGTSEERNARMKELFSDPGWLDV